VSQTSRSVRAVRNPPAIRGVLRLVEDDTAAHSQTGSQPDPCSRKAGSAVPMPHAKAAKDAKELAADLAEHVHRKVLAPRPASASESSVSFAAFAVSA
jgi:hypothetical protein